MARRTQKGVEAMTEPAGSGGLVDAETAIRREVEVLAQRFPDVDRAELDHEVRATYEDLKRDAEIEAHLFALTRAQVTEKLRAAAAAAEGDGEGEPTA